MDFFPLYISGQLCSKTQRKPSWRWVCLANSVGFVVREDLQNIDEGLVLGELTALWIE